MSDYSELERRAQAAIDAIGTLSRARQEREFNDVCTPQVVKDLIAENKRLNADCSSMLGSLKASALSIKKLIKDGGRAARERDRLRAEVAGLKTGYEAYERVNAELKAECEALRREREGKVLCDLELFETLRDSANTEADEHRQCMATYRPLRQENLDSVVKKCDDLLAAMGKGEQP